MRQTLNPYHMKVLQATHACEGWVQPIVSIGIDQMIASRFHMTINHIREVAKEVICVASVGHITQPTKHALSNAKA